MFGPLSLFLLIFAQDRLHLGNLNKLIALGLHYLCLHNLEKQNKTTYLNI